MLQPLLSIVMPCYNSENFIARTIKSVIYQTYTNWELIVVDDVSTDKTFQIVSEFANIDSRIKLFRLSEKGFTHGARNYATNKAQGDFIAFLDSDDLWLKNKLQDQMKFMLKTNCPMTISNNYMMDFGGEIFKKPYINPKVTTYNSLMCKKSAIHFSSVIYSVKQLGKHYFQAKEPEDYMFCLELLKIVPQALNVNEILTVYRISNPLSNSGRKLYCYNLTNNGWQNKKFCQPSYYSIGFIIDSMKEISDYIPFKTLSIKSAGVITLGVLG